MYKGEESETASVVTYTYSDRSWVVVFKRSSGSTVNWLLLSNLENERPNKPVNLYNAPVHKTQDLIRTCNRQCISPKVYGIPKWTKLCRRNKHHAVLKMHKNTMLWCKTQRSHAQNAETSCSKCKKRHAQYAKTSYRDVMLKMQTKVMLKMQAKVMLRMQRCHAQNAEKSCVKYRNVMLKIQRCHAQNAD